MKRTLVALVILAAACGGGDGSDDDGVITVVATTNILGDVVSNVIGDEGVVEVLMPMGADPHEFEASSAQVARILAADLVVANGLGLEEGLEGVLETAIADGANVLMVAPLLDPIEFVAPDDHEDEETDDGEHDLDPHVWMDPIRMARAAELIAEAAAAVVPNGPWMEQAAEYANELRATDTEIATLLTAVPPDRRALITNHATFGYFADRYEWEVLRTVIPGGSSTGSPSSADLAELVELIRDEGVPAIFVETTRPSDLARAVAAEVGSEVGVIELHTESLTGPDGAAATLVDLLLTNARLISTALGG